MEWVSGSSRACLWKMTMNQNSRLVVGTHVIGRKASTDVSSATEGGLGDWQSTVIRALVLTSVVTYFGGESSFLGLWSNSHFLLLDTLCFPLWSGTAAVSPVWAYIRLVRTRSDGSRIMLAIDVLASVMWSVSFVMTMAYLLLTTHWL